VPRPQRALIALRHRADVDGRRKPGRVQLLGRRREQEPHTEGLELTAVALEGPGIPFEVFTRPELQRVDEDRGDDAGAAFACPAHEFEMPVVQGSHRRNEADRARQLGQQCA
jgi:hypothetical protein